MAAKKSKKIAAEDRTFQIGEMISSIEQTIHNLRKVIDDQSELIEIVEASDKKEKFEGFINESREVQSNYEKQISKLQFKIKYLSSVEKALDSPEVKAAVNDLLIGLGVFDA